MSESPEKVEPTTEQPKKKAKSGRGITHLLAVDVETAGANVLDNWMPEFAASFWRIGDRAPTATFYRCLAQPPGCGWAPETMSQFWTNPEKGFDGKTPLMALAERQAKHSPLCDPIGAMHEFVAWARSLEAAEAVDEEIMIVSDTTGFDAQWLAVYLARAGYQGLETLFGQYRPLRDTNSFYFGMGRKFAKWGSESVALEALGLLELPDWVKQYAHNHDPQSDANEIAATASFFLEQLCAERQQKSVNFTDEMREQLRTLVADSSVRDVMGELIALDE
jgi:hypothetical protein